MQTGAPALGQQAEQGLEASLRQAHARLEGGDGEAARSLLAALAKRHPDELRVQLLRAEAERRAQQPGAAAEILQEVERLGGLTPPRRLLRAQLSAQANRHELAVQDFQALLEQQPDNVDALAGLSFCLSRLKRLDEARAAARRLLAVKPFSIRRARQPQGTVLVLEALYLGYVDRLSFGDAIHAPLNVVQTLEPQELDFCHLYVDAPDLEAVLRRLPPIDAIYNNVVNAELAALGRYRGRIERICEFMGVPVLNPPAVVAETTRRRNYERLSQIPGLVFPTTLEARVPAAAEVPRFAEWVAAQVGLPVLVRRIHTHADEDVAVFEDAGALAAWAAGRSGGAFYFIRFLDYRSPDGLYRKYRAAAINGRFFPVHLFFGRAPVVHRNAALFRQLVVKHPGLIDEVYAFLFATDGVLDEAQGEALQRLIELVGLDFVGIDFGILPDGTLAVFEANASMMARSFYPEMYDGLADLVRSDREILRYLESYCANKLGLGRRGRDRPAPDGRSD